MTTQTRLRAVTIGFVVLIVLAGGPAVVAGGGWEEIVVGEPGLEFTTATSHFEPGERATVTVAVTNNGEVRDGGLAQFESQVQTARAVTLDVHEKPGQPFEIKSGPVALGSIQDGQTRTATFTLEFAEDASPGTYRVPLTVTYDHTSTVGYEPTEAQPGYRDADYGTRHREIDTAVEIIVENQPRFEVVTEPSLTVSAGDTGTLSLELHNVGTQTARDARVHLRSNHTAVRFGEFDTPQPTTSVFVSTLDPGASTTIEAQVVTVRDVAPGSYPISVAVEYEKPNGFTDRSRPQEIGIDVGREQSFAVRDVNSSLSVGDDGTVRATLVNMGPSTVGNTIVVYRSDSRTLHPTETEYAVGDMAAGDSVQFQFEFDVSEEADAGPRMPSFVVRYRNDDGEVRTSEPLDLPVQVAPKSDPFRVEPVTTTVTAGSHTTVELEVTNTGTETLTDVEAKLFADDPLASDNDEAFVGRLEPGESTTVLFDVGAAGGVIAKTYPISIDFTYEDAGGDTELSDTYRIPIDVIDPSTGGLPWPLLMAVSAGLIGFVLWKRKFLKGLR